MLAILFTALIFSHVALASLPLVDFDRMGKVGLAGAFAGLDLSQNSSSAVSFDPSTSTILSRSPDGSLVPLASTNSGGRILAACAIGDVVYFAGSFTSVRTTSANNIVSYASSSGSFAPLGSNGPNDQIDALYCDEKDNQVWVGGNFTSPGAAVAVWNSKAASWSQPPFVGFTGASARVLSITSNSSASSLFFAGSFITSFQGNSSTVFNDTNNPNVPFSVGATPFSSSLVPIPLQNAQIEGSPSTSNPQFSSIQNILCPAGADGPGNTWFAADGNTAVVTIETFTSIMASGIRLGNTFQNQRGTTGFSVTSLPDNTVQPLNFVNPTNEQNYTCTEPCPLLTDPSIPYQDFLFNKPLSLTGIQIKLSEWTGAAPGLHLLQLLSSGAFASALDSQNGESCFAPSASNTSRTGSWSEKVANTKIAGTTQTVLVSDVAVGTPSSAGPSFTWMPYVSASGNYDISVLVPGCTDFEDCASRTTVQITVFPGLGLPPSVTQVSQQNSDDATILVYSGPILPSSPDFVTTVSMALADDPVGSGQGGTYELVADRVQMILKSVNTTSGDGAGNKSAGGAQGTRDGFGFFEWPLSSSTPNIDGTKTLPNSTQTSLDAIAFDFLSAIGGNSTLESTTLAIAAIAHHSSGTIFLGGNFNLSLGASSASNIVAFKDGALSTLSEGGLNGLVSSLVLDGDNLFVGGSFFDTSSPSSQGALRSVAIYDILQDKWKSLEAGVNGAVTSLGVIDGQVQVAGSFSTVLDSANRISGVSAAGFAAWNISSGGWVNSGGFIVGNMTLIANGTSSSQFLAGSITASNKFGASGMVMLTNGGSDGPIVTPLGVQLDGSVSSTSTSTSKRRRAHVARGAAAWIPHIVISQFFSRQTSSQPTPLPAAQPAPAPAVLAGAFWTNSSSSTEFTIIGGNFSFMSSGQTESQAVGIYNPSTAVISALQGDQINGTVRSLLVKNDKVYVGGEFTVKETNANSFAIYDLDSQQWVASGSQPLQASSGSAVVVRSITVSSSKPDTVVVAGTFSQIGSLRCQSICLYDVTSGQWNILGNGIQGEVAAVAYAGDNEELLIASGSITLSDNTPANVAQYSFLNASWTAVGTSTDIPGPVTAVEVNNGNSSSIFAAGQSFDGTQSFLSFWNGQLWTVLGSTLQGNTTIAQLAMVPLQNTHSANGVIEPDRVLMVSGSLADSSFGNASAALFDGQTFFPYFISSSSTGAPGAVSSLFHSFATFNFSQHHFLATGVVILISIAIAAGIVFLLALTGIVWTLFSRRDDKLNKFDPADTDNDDDSIHHRPSSLLEHINAATRTTILGGPSPFGTFNADKEEKISRGPSPVPDHDPFGPDAGNYIRADTPSDAVGVAMAEEASRPAHARYSFDGVGQGELAISAGAEVEVLDDRDPAWWYARDTRTGLEGVVPAAYLY